MVLESCINLLKYYKLLGESAMDQLTDEELFSNMESSSNSIPIIVQHLSGNMLSRWSDFLISDGEKPWRKRDEEFLPSILTRDELNITWNKGRDKLFEALSLLSEDQLTNQEIHIRNQGHFIIEAIHRQLAHYAYHVGQIVWIAKDVKKSGWKSLSFSKGNSANYNQEKFNEAI